MTTDKTDKLIREKMEQFQGIPDGSAFDKQRSWERMRFRMEKPASRKLPWWKYAAAILILISGIYGVVHYLGLKDPSTMRSGNLSSHVEKRITVKPLQTVRERASTAIIQKKENGTVKKGGPEKEARQPLVVKSGKQQIASDHAVPVVPTVHTDTPSTLNPPMAKGNDDRLADSPDDPHHHPLIEPGPTVRDETPERPPVIAAGAQKLPIVYYKELVQTQTAGPEDLHPVATGKFSIRLTGNDGSGDHFLANRRLSKNPFSIQLSPK